MQRCLIRTVSLRSMRMVKMACEREDCSFIFVAPTLPEKVGFGRRNLKKEGWGEAREHPLYSRRANASLAKDGWAVFGGRDVRLLLPRVISASSSSALWTWIAQRSLT